MMPAPPTRFRDLFAQLGLLDDPAHIASFIAQHRPLAGGLRLHEAPFWSASQAGFLREALVQDSEWSGPADQLARALQPPAPDAPMPEGSISASMLTESG